MDEAESAVAAARDGMAGHVSIASFNMAITMLVAPPYSGSAGEAPDLELEIRQAPTESALRLLRRGEIDMAITTCYPFGPQVSLGGVVQEKLLAEPLVLLTPPQLHLRVK